MTQRPQNPEAVISYTGSKVPQWFMFSSIGSSITFKLLPGWCNENFIGFALCTVVEAWDRETQSDIHCKCKLKSNESSWIVDLGTINYYNSAPVFGSDDVKIKYDLREFNYFDKYRNANEASVQFFVQDLSPVRTPNMRKCGIHILYGNGMEGPQHKRSRYC